jgi:hypothetical protein
MGLDVYRKIRRAALEGHGVRLSAQDVREVGDTDLVVLAARLRAIQVCMEGKPKHRKGRSGVCECGRYLG